MDHNRTGKYLLLLLPMLLAVGVGQELIQNGDFENSLTHWTVEHNNNQGTWQAITGPGYHPDPDYEAYVYKYDRYYTRITQTVDIPSTMVKFSGSARLYAEHLSGSGYYAYATLTVQYLNSSGTELGKTMFACKTANCTMGSTATRHVVAVTSPDWEDYEFVVAGELMHLPGVNPGNVARIAVCLESYGTGCTG